MVKGSGDVWVEGIERSQSDQTHVESCSRRVAVVVVVIVVAVFFVYRTAAQTSMQTPREARWKTERRTRTHTTQCAPVCFVSASCQPQAPFPPCVCCLCDQHAPFDSLFLSPLNYTAPNATGPTHRHCRRPIVAARRLSPRLSLPLRFFVCLSRVSVFHSYCFLDFSVRPVRHASRVSLAACVAASPRVARQFKLEFRSRIKLVAASSQIASPRQSSRPLSQSPRLTKLMRRILTHDASLIELIF